jgi:hypothetical protein
MVARGGLGAAALLGTAVACGGGPVAPATPAPAVVESASVSDATPLADLPLAPGTSCEERARARPICLAAIESQCRSQRGDCEAGCEPRSGPGSSEKEPALRGDIEADRCREGCRQSATACGRTLGARCPSACDADAGR